MRVSCRPGTPNYSRGAWILLDGKPAMFAVAADDAEGWVDVIDYKGKVDENKQLPIRRLSGVVTIELRD